MSHKKNKPIDFEQSLERLKQLVHTMEQGNLPLEASLKHFEEGIGLIKNCQQALKDAEQIVEILTKKNGNESLEPFNNE